MRVVLHPSSFLEWFDGTTGTPLRREFESGRLEVIAPRSFIGETMAAFAARDWTADRLERLGGELGRIGFRLEDPPASELAAWLARGLSASDASYAALASWYDAPLAAEDATLRKATRSLPHTT